MTADEHLDKIVARCRRVPHAYPGDTQASAMAFSTIVAIEGLRLIADHGSEPERGSAKCDLHKIIALWPVELL